MSIVGGCGGGGGGGGILIFKAYLLTHNGPNDI